MALETPPSDILNSFFGVVLLSFLLVMAAVAVDSNITAVMAA